MENGCEWLYGARMFQTETAQLLTSPVTVCVRVCDCVIVLTVPNMIGGASQADVGVLVISARKGEFETGFDRGGQTREHAMLAKTLGLHKLIILVNKMVR